MTFETVRTLSDIYNELPRSIQSHIDGELKSFCSRVEDHIKSFMLNELDLQTKHTIQDFKSTMTCLMKSWNENDVHQALIGEARKYVGSSYSVENDEDPSSYHRFFIVENKEDSSYCLPLLGAMCQVDKRYEERSLGNIKKLREAGYIKKKDIKSCNLLSRALKLQPFYDPLWNDQHYIFNSTDDNWVDYIDDYSFAPNQKIFHYLLEWDTDALREERYHTKERERTPLQEVILYHKKRTNKKIIETDVSFSENRHYYLRPFHYSIDMMRILLKAGLRYNPHQLGLLVQNDSNHEYTTEDDDDTFSEEIDSNKFKRRLSSPYAMACGSGKKTFGPDKVSGWSVIKECLDEAGNAILEQDPKTNLYPFMLAAADRTCRRLDLLYYLLRRDPSVMCDNKPASSSSPCNVGVEV